ncbi:MAG: DUF481 domain-containing protein [Gemmatimonadota bacterium]|nr:DUF481 domain-containing protein [Gemmatimonadota bacterium]
MATAVLLLGTVAGVRAPALAQVDVQPLSREEPPEGRSGSLSADLTAQTGNTDFAQLGVSARIYEVEGAVTTLMVGNGGLGFLGRRRFSSSGLFHYRKTYSNEQWVWPEWYLQANYDRSQLLKFRTLAGGGIRTPVTTGEWGQIGAGFSVMLEDERLDLPDTASHPRTTTTFRSSTFFSLRLVASQLVVTSTTYVQPRFDDLGDVRVLEDLSLATPVTDRLAMTVSFDLRYDSGPPDGLAALDARLRTGLTFTY